MGSEVRYLYFIHSKPFIKYLKKKDSNSNSDSEEVEFIESMLKESETSELENSAVKKLGVEIFDKIDLTATIEPEINIEGLSKEESVLQLKRQDYINNLFILSQENQEKNNINEPNETVEKNFMFIEKNNAPMKIDEQLLSNGESMEIANSTMEPRLVDQFEFGVLKQYMETVKDKVVKINKNNKSLRRLRLATEEK